MAFSEKSAAQQWRPHPGKTPGTKRFHAIGATVGRRRREVIFGLGIVFDGESGYMHGIDISGR